MPGKRVEREVRAGGLFMPGVTERPQTGRQGIRGSATRVVSHMRTLAQLEKALAQSELRRKGATRRRRRRDRRRRGCPCPLRPGIRPRCCRRGACSRRGLVARPPDRLRGPRVGRACPGTRRAEPHPSQHSAEAGAGDGGGAPHKAGPQERPCRVTAVPRRKSAARSQPSGSSWQTRSPTFAKASRQSAGLRSSRSPGLRLYVTAAVAVRVVRFSRGGR